MQSAGYFTVPQGATVRIRLTRSFTSSDMSIRLYEVACSTSSACSGQPASIFSVPAGSGKV